MALHFFIVKRSRSIWSALYLTLLLGVLAPLAAYAEENTQLHVMTFNVRYGLADDGNNSWRFRGPLAARYVARSGADVIGLQEALGFQIDELVSAAPNYSWIGEGRDGGKKGEYTAILYNRLTVKALRSGTFWLSDTPEKPSATWGNRYKRTVTWGLFQFVKTGATVFVYNTHFDHEFDTARIKSSEALAQHIAVHTQNTPVILLGDFNADIDSAPMRQLQTLGRLKDSFSTSHQTRSGTFHNFTGQKNGPSIDHIFFRGKLQLEKAIVDQRDFEGRHVSDHFPVTAVFHMR